MMMGAGGQDAQQMQMMNAAMPFLQAGGVALLHTLR